MKRSEMLNKLYEATDKFISSDSKQNLIDFLLDECEKLGMQPPNITLNELFPNSGLKHTGPVNHYACWEPEDETK